MEPTSIPSHIPADRVRNLSWYGWQDPEGDPPMSLSRSLSGERLFYVPAGARNPFGVWVLTRHDDMQSVLTDGEHFTNSHIAGWNSSNGRSISVLGSWRDDRDLVRGEWLVA